MGTNVMDGFNTTESIWAGWGGLLCVSRMHYAEFRG